MTAATSDRIDRLRLSLLVEAGDARLASLLHAHSAGRIVAALHGGGQLDGTVLPDPWRMRASRSDHTADEARAVLRVARQQAMRWVCPGDAEWPEGLGDLDLARPINHTRGAPLGLWVRGRPRLAAALERSVAVVGARDATTYGCEVAGDLAADLADGGITVVSGAAYGIDSCAHRGALALQGPTMAVLACGADVDYPRAHAGLLARIADQGLVVSEQAPGQTPTKGRFLTRNRLIAALSRGTVVVEAARRSGALNTLNWAAEIGRVAMGVPGPVTSQASVGVHQSLRSGQSVLVTSGAEVIEAVGAIGSFDATLPSAPATDYDALPPAMKVVLEAVPGGVSATAEAIAATVPCAVDDARTVLDVLAERGWVQAAEGRWRLARRADLSVGRLPRTVTR